MQALDDYYAIRQVISRAARVIGYGAALSYSLRDWKVWQNLSRAEQRLACEYVVEKLGAPYRVLDSNETDFSGTVVVDSQSNSRYCLVPGGEQQLNIEPTQIEILIERAVTYMIETDRNRAHGMPLNAEQVKNKFQRYNYEPLYLENSAICEPLLVSRFPVTFSESQNGSFDFGRPASNMCWLDAYDWVELNRPGFRMLTADEWQCACRAGTNTAFYWTSENNPLGLNLDGFWHAANSNGVEHQVGEKRQFCSAFGLSEMIGNVPEYVGGFFHVDELEEFEEPIPKITPYSVMIEMIERYSTGQDQTKFLTQYKTTISEVSPESSAGNWSLGSHSDAAHRLWSLKYHGDREWPNIGVFGGGGGMSPYSSFFSRRFYLSPYDDLGGIGFRICKPIVELCSTFEDLTSISANYS